MSRQLKISGDTSELRKSLIDISRMVKQDLGKSKIELFSPETKKMLRGEVATQAEAIKKQIDKIRESTQKHAEAQKNVLKGSKEELKIREKILKAHQHMAKLAGDQAKMEGFGEQLGGGKGFLSTFKKQMGKLPILNKLSGLGGMSAAGIGGLMAGGAILGAGAYGVSRLMAARETYGEGVDTRVKLRGRGISDFNPTDTAGMYSAGLNSLSLRQARLRDLDVFGASGATQKSVIQRAQFERNFGVEEGTLSGIAGGFRSSMGGAQANQTLMKLQASLIASGISDAIGPYLETAAAMLTELNERGFTMDESVMSLFNSMAKMGMGEGRIQQLAMGVDSGIRGASGEANAFFQNVFNKQGIGGGTIGGAQAAMRMGGLFGADLSKYKAMGGTDRKALQMLGIGGADHMQRVATGTLGTLDQLFGSEADIKKQMGSKDPRTAQGGALKRLSRLRYMMSAFGLKDEGQAAEVEGLLKKAKNASPEEQKKIMRKVQDIKESTPELENLKKINQSNEGIYQLLQNEKKTIEDAIGEATSGAFNTMNALLNSIDKAILAIAKFLTGYETPEEQAAKVKQEQADLATKGQEAAARALKGFGNVSSEDMSAIKNGLTYEQGVEFTKKLKQKVDLEGDGFMANTSYKKLYESDAVSGYRRGIEGAERRRLREGRSSQFSTPMNESSPTAAPTFTSLENILKKNNTLLSKQVRSSEVIAKHAKERGTLKPGSGSTSGN